MRLTPSRAPNAGRARRRLRTRALATGVALVTAAPLALIAATGPAAAQTPPGQGFTLNASDLRFILRQIKISENHAATPRDPANPCAGLLGSGPNQIPNNGVGVAQPLGLRTVDGTCNNLVAGQRDYGTADRIFPRLVPKDLKGAETGDPDGPGPAGPEPTSYTQTQGTVIDSGPRVVSNLIVDQTADNPAAEAAAGSDADVTPSGAFFIPNVATDVGLSAPYNSWFTLFGQFFDHGLDLVSKGGNGNVFMPLQPDDPLYRPGAPTNFMVLSRATQTGDHEAKNQTSPFVDQSQTYTSHPSHQVFMREQSTDHDNDPLTPRVFGDSGRMLTGPGGGMADWDAVQEQSRTFLGIELTDYDVTRIPLLATDQYGHFIPGPNGRPQLVTAGGLVEGDPAAPVAASSALPTGHGFLDDIAHHAVPFFDDDRNPETPDARSAPDTDTNGTTDDGDRTTYDDEMLGRHFVAGDGRVNENIGLITVHHVFHSEHNRLRENIDSMINSSLFTAAEQADWKATDRPGGWDYGDRLFQAARFVTEMEYQHLAFEEFVRKVQPMVNLFGEGGTGYHTEIDPAITAEFAHAVYRFGHSMLTESVDRVRADGRTRDDIPLLQAFLNPPSFTAGYASPDAAAGAVVRGMTRQVGNELDEFVTEALRNELLGLPLDLASLNMARARDTGVPGLNAARRKFFAVSSNAALEPYKSWADLGFGLKHAESLPNFIAAYGQHPTVKAATTMDAKRAAANAIVYGEPGPDGILNDVPNAPRPEVDETADNIPAADVPVDSYAFLNSTTYDTVDETDPDNPVTTTHSEWTRTSGGLTTTGVDLIDLWVGGLAEKQMVFGGLLGSTFNYVFEGQAESLQDGDRFYYLSRTAGLNLLTQLEGNSFAELIQRNTDATSLPADSFSRPDHVYEVARLGTSGAVLDDPDTTWNESVELTREPDGTIRYAGPLHTVWNGSAGNDKVRASEGDDTIRGNDGNDRIEGGDGADNLIGGLGDDILTDLFGDDVLKGGDGDDVLSSGQGFGGDLNQSGTGNDYVIGGNDTTETFAGEGNDFVYAGDAEDTVFGDGGDDWIEGGKGPFNLLQGDNGAPFQDDPNEAGHDVLFGFGGETDNDAEGGDDIMFAGSLIQRNEGMLGYDWVTYKGMEPNPQPADADLSMTQFVPPDAPSDVNRDRFDLVESVSGWDLDDLLIGDDRTADDLGTEHQLNTAGIARIDGLAALLPAGATSFNAGNIILGGGGSDVLQGMGGDDILDGDKWLDAELRAPVPATADPADRQTVERMAPLNADVLAGRIDPSDIAIVRSIKPGPATGSDTARFSGPRADYDITFGTGVTTVAHTRGTAADGTDTLRNVESLQFSDVTVPNAAVVVTQAPAPTALTAVAGNAQATLAWTAPTTTGGAPITGYRIQVRTGTTVARTVDVPVTPTTGVVVTGLTNGTAYNFRVRAVTSFGLGVLSAPTADVTPVTLAAAPGTPVATAGNAQVGLTWTAPTANGGSAVTGYRVQVRTGTTVVRNDILTTPATSAVIAGLTNGTAYNFRVRAVTAVGLGVLSAPSNTATPAVVATVPGAPGIGTAVRGAAGAGNGITATANWTPPGSTGGSPITGYRVVALRVNVSGGPVLATTQSAVLPRTARTLQMALAAGNYQFQVVAINAIGPSVRSTRSNMVDAR